MSRLIPRLNLLAICLLAAVVGCVLVAQVRPQPPATARAQAKDNDWEWPKTLEVCPSRPGDPVMLVKIIKGGQEVVPAMYRMPEVSGDASANDNAFNDWLKDASFVLENQTSKSIVSVGIAVVFPARETSVECSDITGYKVPHDPWCDAHPHYCDGGCPALIHKALHWGRIPAMTASGLEARYRAERRQVSADLPEGIPLQGKEWLRIAPGQEVALSLAGRTDGWTTVTDPRHGFSNSVNVIVYQEGIEEAQDTEPCFYRANSKTGCAFREVSKFNIGVDIVYFDDGTIWGNFGYGYAMPGADGIFTRVGTGQLEPTPRAN